MSNNDFLDDLLNDIDPDNTPVPNTIKSDGLSDKMKDAFNQVYQIYTDRGLNMERFDTQKHIVEKILISYESGKKAFILQAPTGSGKSIIGIAASESISIYEGDEYNSFFLTSSKQLQDQLQSDINRLDIDWTILKGRANYTCTKNGLTFIERACAPYSISKVKQKWDCASECQYILARDAAIEKTTCVTSYAYFLTVMNFSFEFLKEYSPFYPRTVTLMDECHQIADIVQNMFGVKISVGITKRIEKMVQNILMNVPSNKELNIIKDRIEEFNTCILYFVPTITDTDSPNKVFVILNKIINLGDKLIDALVEHMNEKHNSKKLIKHQQDLENQFDMVMNLIRSIKFFVKNNEEDISMVHVETEVDKFKNFGVILRTVNEPYMLKQHLHKYTGFGIFMSATIGGSEKDIHTFAADKGIEEYEFAMIPSDFNYENSEIFKIKPMINLGSKYIKSTIGNAVKNVIDIADFHKNFKGIVHTTSFYITRAIKERVKNNSRFLFYDNSDQKQQMIELHKTRKNTILVGPSLIEGLDLPDDHARFSIIVKVPYPALSSFNKRKMDRFKGWYDWQTTVSFMQALGRPIRHKDDWAVTYLIDSNFNWFLNKNQLPEFVSKRYRSIESASFESDESKAEKQKEIDDLFEGL